ncbi:MAG: serine/threonine protein kinase [Deltaproteobacteria bacterium]|nr:serine/threonine protein kinase [Deltaproteobacteria bacterium]
MAFAPALTLAEVTTALAADFAMVSEVAVGGQGAVFKGSPIGNPSLEVAVKIYVGNQVDERTDREIAAIRGFRSPTIVTMHSAGQCVLRGNTHRYLATEFISGAPLDRLIANGPLSISDTAKIARDVATAIEIIWQARIVHRDVKPSNILVRPDGSAVLVDLGVARHLQLASLTTWGKTWGTEGYLSPEQMRGLRNLTCKSDIFGLGLVVQEAIGGRHPTLGNQRALLNGGRMTSSISPNLPHEFVALVDAMVNGRPVVRPLPREVITRCQPFI